MLELFLNGPTPASFLFIFVLFYYNFTEKQTLEGFELDRWSQERWPPNAT